ncbi:MAG: hypothetical protein AB9882_13280 [Ignavibacteriaceae bacterium]
MSDSQSKAIFFDRLTGPALNAELKYNIPSLVILSLAAFQSNWGKNTRMENLFLMTEDSGKSLKQYPNAYSAIDDFCEYAAPLLKGKEKEDTDVLYRLIVSAPSERIFFKDREKALKVLPQITDEVMKLCFMDM